MKKLIFFALLLCISVFGLTACNCGGNTDGGEKHKHEYVPTVTAPDCTARGYTTFTCECGRSYRDNYTDPLGHNYENNVCARCGYIRHDHKYEKTVIAPTCTEKGYTIGQCYYCSARYTADYTDPLGHNFDNGKCTRCGYFDSTEHKHNYTQKVTEPTCTEKGYTSFACECGDVYIDYLPTPALGHNFVDGICTRCNSENYTESLVFTLSDDGDYYIVKGLAATSTDTEIIIPSKYNGKPVKAIRQNAFINNLSIESIIIPDGVTTIGYNAFIFCKYLTSVSIPDSVASIGNQAFGYCEKLTNIVIPDGVTSLGEAVFRECVNLKSVTLGKGITSIRDYAFDGCESLTSIIIPDKVTSIGSNAFVNCKYLASVNIPDSILTIGDCAFMNCSGLKNVTLGNGVISIGINTFAECSKLTTITIPESLTSIGSCAFEHCYYLTYINFNGTVEQWNAIVKGKDWDMGSGNYVIRCTDGDIAKPVATLSKDGLVYSLSDDGTYYICNGTDPTISSIIADAYIASDINGIPVKEIGASAFMYDKGIQSVTLPDRITTIGNGAFHSCSSLKSINIPDGVTNIGNYAFYGCTSLTSIKIPNGVTSFESYTFTSCTNLTEIIFNGTKQEWQSIPHTDWLYMSTACTVYCTDGELTIKKK